MIQIRRASERGHFNHGWLDTYHTFSFAEYQDPQWMGYRALRVINEDWVAPGMGFPTHSHRDMEIITYILEGELEHKDSMGNTSRIYPGEVQRMSAGTGVTHSEYNPSKDKKLHLLQLWILPEKKGQTPGYEQKTFSQKQLEGKLCLVASRDGREGSVKIGQDVDLYAARLTKGSSLNFSLKENRAAWLQVAKGEVEINGTKLKTSDAVAVSEEKVLAMKADSTAEILLFDLR